MNDTNGTDRYAADAAEALTRLAWLFLEHDFPEDPSWHEAVDRWIAAGARADIELPPCPGNDAWRQAVAALWADAYDETTGPGDPETDAAWLADRLGDIARRMTAINDARYPHRLAEAHA